MLRTVCMACRYGDHAGCQGLMQAAPVGGVGGSECSCACRTKTRTPTLPVATVARMEASVEAEIARLKAENERLRELYENVVGNRERFGWTINHLLECDEALRVAEARVAELESSEGHTLIPNEHLIELATSREPHDALTDAALEAARGGRPQWPGTGETA
jgi:hypothetical protein